MIRLYIAIFVEISLISCKETDEFYINQIIKLSDFISNKEGWEYSFKDPKNRTFIIQKGNEDKYSEVKFKVDDFKGEEYIILEYHFSKEKSNNSFKYLYFSKSDTLCSYYQKDTEKDFVFGKYYYLYEIERLKSEDFDPHALQVDYYYKNRDSLIDVRGNDLPELPKAKLKKERSKSIEKIKKDS